MLGTCIMPCIFFVPDYSTPYEDNRECCSKSTSTHSLSIQENTSNHLIVSDLFECHDDLVDDVKMACPEAKQIMVPHCLKTQFKENIFEDVINDIPWFELFEKICPRSEEMVLPLEFRLTSGCTGEKPTRKCGKMSRRVCYEEDVCRRSSKSKCRNSKTKNRRDSDLHNFRHRNSIHRNSLDIASSKRHSGPRDSHKKIDKAILTAIALAALGESKNETEFRHSKSSISKLRDSKRDKSDKDYDRGIDDSKNISNNRSKRRKARRLSSPSRSSGSCY